MSNFCRFILIIKVETTSFFHLKSSCAKGGFFRETLSHETMDIAQVLRGKQPGGREKCVYMLHCKKLYFASCCRNYTVLKNVRSKNHVLSIFLAKKWALLDITRLTFHSTLGAPFTNSKSCTFFRTTFIDLDIWFWLWVIFFMLMVDGLSIRKRSSHNTPSKS